MAMPGPGYSITMRIAAPPSATAAGDLTTAVGRAGGVITAFDVVESTARRDGRRHLGERAVADARRRDHRRGRRAAGRRGPQGRPTGPSCCTSAARSRSHSKVPLRNRDDLSRAYTPGRRPGLHGDRGEPGRRPAADHQAQHRRRGHRRHRRARPRQHRPGRGAAGDGGQGRAVQAVRRGRRLAGLPGHHRHRGDHPHRAADRAGATAASTSRTSPRRAASRSRRGCGSCWTSRSSTTTSTAPRSWCWPRCATRCGWSARTSRTCRIVVSGVGAAGNAIIRLLLLQQPARHRRRATSPGSSTPAARAWTRNLAEVADRTNRARRRRHAPRRDGRRRRVHRGLRAELLIGGSDSPTMDAGAIVFALANPDPEIDPLEAQPARRRGRHRPVRLPEPDQQRARVPRRVPRPARRPGAREITDDMLLAAAEAIADVVSPDAAERVLHRAQRVRRGGGAGGRPRRLPGGAGDRLTDASRCYGRKYVGFGSLNVRSAKPPLRSLYWSPKFATMSNPADSMYFRVADL